MRRRSIAVLALAALALGCGGDGDGEERSPQERLEAVLPDYERAVADQDCRAFARFAHSSVRAPGRAPDDPPTADECRNLGNAYTRLAGFEAQRTRVFGNAAVVEGQRDAQLMALVWVVDVDGRWKQVQATPPGTSPQIDAPPRPQDRYGPNAEAFTAAMRAGDCRKAYRLLNPASPFLENETEPAGAFCSRFRRSFRAPERLAGQLAAAPDAKPVDLGGTPDFRFFRLDTGRDRHWTLILSTLPPALPAGEHLDDSVLDYYPTGELSE
jgi:hypothetical protein